VKYLKDNDLLPDLRRIGPYTEMHSTETAVLKVLADALDSGDLAMLTLLDLSAPYEYDSADHATSLLKRLQKFYRVGGQVL